MAQQLQPGEKDIWKIVQAIIQVVNGRHNAGGLVQLDPAPATTTTVSHPNCSLESAPTLTPANLAAASELGAGTCYVDTVQNGSFVIHHSSSASARRFYYQVSGG